MDIIPGYWVCSCGYFNDEELTWCVECVKKRVDQYIPHLKTHEKVTESRTSNDNS